MAEKNSVYRSNSRYVAGGVTETNKIALEWWERNQLKLDVTDRIYIVEKKFAGRLDQISALFLNESRYWWIIAMLNNILDPYSEVKEGIVLYIPTTDRVSSLMTGQVGGVDSTREVPTSILPIV